MALTGAWPIVLFIAVSAIAMSYGWGMRGTTLGGEKGAMLPGALMGLLMAVFSGSPFLLGHFYLLSAAGALGIYFGGSMSYMQSVGLSSDRNPPEDFKRGIAGLAVKGSIWFGIFGAVMGMFLTFLAGGYGLSAVLPLFALMPLACLAGSRLFDRPFDEGKGIHPKIYFSKNRPEGMGVLFGILAELVVFAAVYRDAVALWLTLGSTVSGGAGFVLAQLLHIRAKYPNKRGWQFLKKARGRGWIDTWKIAECTYGAIAGLGISTTFVLIANFSPAYRAQYITAAPQLLDIPPWILPAVFAALLGLDMLKYAVRRPKTEQELRYMRSRGWMSDAELELALRKAGKEPTKAWLFYEKAAHVAEFPVYCYIPLAMLFLGSKGAAQLVSFYVLYYVILEQQLFERFKRFKTIILWRAALLGLGFFVVFAQFYWGWTPGLLLTALMYGAGYEALTLVGNIAKNSPDRHGRKTVKESSLREAYGGIATMHGYYFVCIAAVTAFAAFAARL
ncbi:MAG: hypothetical protein LBB75_06690 [Oscillospiraceae bacterium]|jgi:hypothetical protein|nr:hypothetical protein [Oscillospiraceae bacterium]